MPVYSQTTTDTIVNESVSAFRNIYFNEIKGNALLYRGVKYYVKDNWADGFPYFESGTIRQHSITFQGTRYDVPLYYDLVTDLVVTYNYQQDDLISLDSDKIDSFTIGSHLFVQLSKSDGLPKNGFYDQLYGGEPGLYVRRKKKFYYGIGNQQSRYVEKNDYFIRYQNVFFKSDSKSDMLHIFGDQANALKKYIHNNSVDFKEDFESALSRCVIYYAGLKR